MRSKAKSLTGTPRASVSHSTVRSAGRSTTSVARTGARCVAHVRWRRDHVQRRVAIDEPERLEPEDDNVDGHHRPIYRPGVVVVAEPVPHPHIRVLDGPRGQFPGTQASVMLRLV